MRKAMLFITAWLCLTAGISLAAELEKYQFLKLSPQDQRAVVKTPEGQLQVIGVGDLIAENARVIEVAEGRVVLEQVAGEEMETVIVRLDGKYQRFERVRKAGVRPLVGLPR